MKGKFKYVAALALTLIMCSETITYAAEAVSPKTSGRVEITLQTAVDMMVKNNPEIKLFERRITVAEKEYKDAEDKRWSSSIKNPKKGITVLDIKRQQEYNWKKALFDYNNAKHDKDEKIKELKVETEKIYLDILSIKNDLKSYEKDSKELDTKIEETKYKIKNGLLKESDIKSLEVEKSQLLSQISNSKSELDKSIIKLRKYLSLSNDTELILADNNFDFVKFDDSNIEKKINEAVDKSYELERKKEDLELAQIDCDLIKKYSFIKDDTYMENVNDGVRDKELQLEFVKPDLEASLWGSYYNLKVLENSVEIETLSLKSIEQSINDIRAKIETGALSKNKESEKLNELEKQKIKLQRTINDYVNAVNTFNSKLETRNDKE